MFTLQLKYLRKIKKERFASVNEKIFLSKIRFLELIDLQQI